MARLWQLIMKGETGQALLIVLGLLVIGGLLIAPCLHYASTSLKAGIIIEENVKGIYAADAGVENALWQIGNGIEPPEVRLLPENVNRMQVSVQTDNMGSYTLYRGGLIEVGEPPKIHYDWVAVEGKMEEVAEGYKYTITVTWQPYPGTPVIHLYEVGARLPVGYEYELGSAASFEDNLSPVEPDDILDGASAHLLNWDLSSFDSSLSLDNQTATQTFYVTGEGDQGGDYAWVEADPNAIGEVGDVIGTFYRITATATRPEDGEITARVVADVIFNEVTEEGTEKIHSISWQINPQ